MRAHRPVSISSVPVSEGIEIRQGCQPGSELWVNFPVVLVRFYPARLVGICPRLRHLGWDQCSHRLTSRPLASCHHHCLQAVCKVLGYPEGAAAELLDGTLKLRYCTTVLPSGPLLGLFLGEAGKERGATAHLSHDDSCTVKPGRHVPEFLCM